MPRKRTPFWERVDVKGPDECWPWLGARWGKKREYGQYRVDGKGENAHRAAFRLGAGIDPGESLVCHHCDFGLCCNPRHLFLGTNQDNMDDRDAKGRARGGHPPGERNPVAKLTNVQADEIRRRYGPARRKPGPRSDKTLPTQDDLATEYGVSTAAISRIVIGESYA